MDTSPVRLCRSQKTNECGTACLPVIWPKCAEDSGIVLDDVVDPNLQHTVQSTSSSNTDYNCMAPVYDQQTPSICTTDPATIAVHIGSCSENSSPLHSQKAR